MKLSLLAPCVLLIATMLTACSDEASKPANGAGAASAAGDTGQKDSDDDDLRRDLDAIATSPTPLLAEEGVPKASIAANGDFEIGGKPVAIDDAQRTRLLAYRTQLVTMTQAGIELGARSTSGLTTKIGGALGKLFEGESPGDLPAELKAEGKRLDAIAKRICDTLPVLLREQDALARALPSFKAYARFTQTDADACRGSTITDPDAGEKIGQTIGAAAHSQFKGGLVSGFMASHAAHADAGKVQPAESQPPSKTQ